MYRVYLQDIKVWTQSFGIQLRVISKSESLTSTGLTFKIDCIINNLNEDIIVFLS